ncbi:MAG: hypothetical protein FWG21_04960 [Oscillospiraceae bacterium]|nr:hypothetical protein [Oscillospiraceae bacterium]
MIYENLFKNTDGIVHAGLIGAGSFGSTIVTQGSTVPRLEIRVVAELNLSRAHDAYINAGVSQENIKICRTLVEANQAYDSGFHVIVEDALLLMDMPLDVIACETRSPECGAVYAKATIQAGKHLVMVDKEADSVVGSLLKKMADDKGVVYTTDDGDEPGLLMGMIGWARSMGFEVLSGGNTHEAMFDPQAKTISSRGKVVHLSDEEMKLMERVNKDNLREVIEARRALTSVFFLDEECGDPYCHMAVAANGTGLLPDRKTPIHPLVYWDELPSVLIPAEMGGINDNTRSVVDIPTIIRKKGDPPYGGSIFLVIRCDNAYAMEKMRRKGFITNFDTTTGVLYRPYHLCGAETAMSILCAGLLNTPTGSSEILPLVDIICTTRRDMKAGEMVGPLGDSGWNRDFKCELVDGFALTDSSPIPFYMLEGNKFAKDIPEGTLITMDMVQPPESSTLWELRYMQDKLFADMLK